MQILDQFLPYFILTFLAFFQIVVETPEEEFITVDDFAIAGNEFNRREHKVAPFCSMRLTRDMSSKAKAPLKKRMSLLDELERHKPEMEGQKPIGTPPLYKKMQRRSTSN